VATLLFRWLVPSLPMTAENLLLPHRNEDPTVSSP
jgi:hypothetical protein